MKTNINYNNYILNKDLNLKLNDVLNKKFFKVFKEISSKQNYLNSLYQTLNKNFSFNFNINSLSKFKKFKTVVIIGMGGSILGAEAIYSFLQSKIKKKFYFFNNLDIEKLSRFKKKENFRKTLFLIISKSGNTIETISNFHSLKIIKKNSKNVIIISEKKNNYLYNLSKKMNLYHLEHRSNIGGRYSVLSEIGMTPAYFMGLNLKNFKNHLLNELNSKNKKLIKDNSLKLTNLFLNKKYKSFILLNYIPELNKFLYWYQQLLAESLGKKGKGFLPLVSEAPKDHHSLLQLYLDGPKDKVFNIFSDERTSKEKIRIKYSDNDSKFLNKSSLYQLKKAQKNALINSLKKNKIPFREFKIKNFDEKNLGELFTFFIYETIFVGKLSNINPFNQPAVEQVKLITKKLLRQ